MGEFDDVKDITAWEGPYGRAWRVPPLDPNHPELSEKSRKILPGHLTSWLIYSPGWHPLWSQYVLDCIKLIELPGVPPANHKFEGTTHQVLVVALEPREDGRLHTKEEVYVWHHTGMMPFLNPVNIAEQFEATDDEMIVTCSLAVRSVVFGQLNPDTADAPLTIRTNWLESFTKCLAHLRGEEHEH